MMLLFILAIALVGFTVLGILVAVALIFLPHEDE